MTATTCSNPRCSCDPCGCGDACRCTGATHLGELEQKVMDAVWGAGGREVSAREVSELLEEYAYTTVATVLNRLSRKGELRRRMAGRVTCFAPSLAEADRAAAGMEDLVRNAKDVQSVLRSFAQRLEPAELDVLRRVLSEPEGQV